MSSRDHAPPAESSVAEFVSPWPVQESIKRLATRLDRSTLFWGLHSGAKEGLCGHVDEHRVYLMRWVVGRGKQNRYSPAFVGHFIERDGQVILSGRFRCLWPMVVSVVLRLVMVCGIVAAAGVFGWSIWMRGSMEGLIIVALAAAIVIILVALSYRAIRELGREDIPWLRAAIARALNVR